MDNLDDRDDDLAYAAYSNGGDDDDRSSSRGFTLMAVAFAGVFIAALVGIIVFAVISSRNATKAKQQAAKLKAARKLDQQVFNDGLVGLQQDYKVMDANGKTIKPAAVPPPTAPDMQGIHKTSAAAAAQDDFVSALNSVMSDDTNSSSQDETITLVDTEPDVRGITGEDYIRQLRRYCPKGKILKTITSRNGPPIINCYEPCPKGMDAVAIDTSALDRPTGWEEFKPGAGEDLSPWQGDKKNGTPNGVEPGVQPTSKRYWACRARCTPRKSVTDPVEDATYCPRFAETRWDKIGKGKNIKCPYITQATGFGYSYKKKWLDNGPDWYQGMAQPWSQDTIHDTSDAQKENSVCNFDKGNRTYVTLEPVACAHNYELIPVTRYAYWTINWGRPIGSDLSDGTPGSSGDDYVNVWSQLGSGRKLSEDKKLQKKMIGRRCVEQCPEGSTMIGDPEDMICASQCPVGTNENPVTRSVCTKDGITQVLIMENLQELVTTAKPDKVEDITDTKPK